MARKKTGAFNAQHPFGKPEEPKPTKVILIATFIVLGVLLIGWMILTAPAEKRLKCSGPNSLISFGTCTEE